MHFPLIYLDFLLISTVTILHFLNCKNVPLKGPSVNVASRAVGPDVYILKHGVLVKKFAGPARMILIIEKLLRSEICTLINHKNSPRDM